MNPLYTLFYELSKQLEQFFGIHWIKVHELSSNLLSGYGFYKRPEVKIWITDFVNLRVSLNPKKYELDCSNESLYARIDIRGSAMKSWKNMHPTLKNGLH